MSIKLWFDVAVGIVIFAILGLLLWQYDQHKLDVARADALTLAVSTQTANVAALQRGQDADTSSIHDMALALQQGSVHAVARRQNVVTMGKNDAKLGTWLDTPIPGQSGCMLDDTCASSDSASPPIGSASAAVRGR